MGATKRNRPVRLTDLVVDDGPHNSGFRRARFFIFAPDSQAKHACRQAEFPLNALFKIPEPPLTTTAPPLQRFRLFGQLPGRNKLKDAGSRLLVSPFPEIKFILSCCGVL